MMMMMTTTTVVVMMIRYRNFPHPTTCWWGVENYDTLPSEDDDDDNGDGDGGPPVLERVQL